MRRRTFLNTVAIAGTAAMLPPTRASDTSTEKSEPVATLDVTNVGSNSATLNGELTSLEGQSSADVWFKYGRVGEGILFETPKQTLSNTTTFDDDVTNLDPDVEYDFWAIAELSSGAFAGDVLQFTTDQ